MFRKIGQRFIVFDASNDGGAGGGVAHPVAPWGSEGLWNVAARGDAAKPWHSFLTDEAARQHVEAKGYANPNELALANYSLTKMQRGDPSVRRAR